MSAPLLLFVYNRPYHTLKMIEAISRNEGWEKTDVYVFCDAPKENATETQLLRVKQVRDIVQNIAGCRDLHITFQEENKGLYTSIINGVSGILQRHKRAIILEDDLVTAPNFLSFMNAALEKYEQQKNVHCISGYTYPIPHDSNEAFFIKGADCWGWATWIDRWEKIQTNPSILKKELQEKQLEDTFNFGGSYPYMQMLEDRIAGKNQSWAILWYASALIQKGLCLYPAQSLVANIGNDGSGTHNVASSTAFDTNVKDAKSYNLPDAIVESEVYRKRFISFFKKTQRKPSLLKRAIGALKRRVRYYFSKIKNRIAPPKKEYGWFGDYATWQEASAECGGYDQEIILETVKDALLKVKYGVAKYERDSVLFDEIKICETLLYNLQKVADQHHGQLHVIDFGGSLGSTYFQNREYLKNITTCHWSIVEQPNYVAAGKNYLASDELHFYNSIKEAQQEHAHDVLILSSVLQYLPNPYDWMLEMKQFDFETIIIDRTAFVKREKDRITKQIVPPSIYEASYPAWYFNEEKFIEFWSDKYTIEDTFDSGFDPSEFIDNEWTYRNGFILKRKK